ncbi:MAG: LPP20 family lipoprotein [Pseudomonadota bacterium]
MKSYTLWAITLIAVSTLAGCAGKPNKPDWMMGDTPRYQEAEFLIGHGDGVTSEEAKDRARTDLAKIFSVSVIAESSDVSVFKGGESGHDQGQERTETNISRTLNTRTDQIMQGVRIAEMWHDPQTQRHYALAALRRTSAAMSLRQEISRLDDATAHNVERARNASDLFDKIGAARQALDAQMERAAYQKSLKVVDRTGQGMPSSWTVERLRADLDDLLKRARIGVRVGDDATGRLSQSVAGGLAAAGMAETRENPDYLVDARLDLADLGRREGWHWVTGTLQVQLSERASERIRGTKRWSIKASAQDSALARQRALDQVDQILKKELGDAVMGFVVNKHGD